MKAYNTVFSGSESSRLSNPQDIYMSMADQVCERVKDDAISDQVPLDCQHAHRFFEGRIFLIEN
jgi:hypothetical protein